MKDETIISGIHCEVENCVYNNGSCCCTADHITVGNRPMNSEEGVCETFSEI